MTLFEFGRQFVQPVCCVKAFEFLFDGDVEKLRTFLLKHGFGTVWHVRQDVFERHVDQDVLVRRNYVSSDFLQTTPPCNQEVVPNLQQRLVDNSIFSVLFERVRVHGDEPS